MVPGGLAQMTNQTRWFGPDAKPNHVVWSRIEKFSNQTRNPGLVPGLEQFQKVQEPNLLAMLRFSSEPF